MLFRRVTGRVDEGVKWDVQAASGPSEGHGNK